ncbi:MAG: hypothetical protein ABJA82_03905 [Myxococcales bacterium]
MPAVAALSDSNPIAAEDGGTEKVETGEAASAAAQERDRQLSSLRTSGPDARGLMKKVEGLRSSWEALAVGSGIDVKISSWECYQGGCFSTIIHRAAPSVEELTTKIFDTRDLAGWLGPTVRSAPIPGADGTAEVTWFLLLPAEQAANGGPLGFAN